MISLIATLLDDACAYREAGRERAAERCYKTAIDFMKRAARGRREKERRCER